MTVSVVAYQGEPGAYSELAAQRFAIGGAAYLPCRRFDEVFDALARGTAQRAVVPYVNSLAGPVTMSCALLARWPVRVLDETRLRISHALLASPAATLDGLRYALSHPVALRQCLRFFRQYPWIKPMPMEDTAGAVAHVLAHGTKRTAAIAGKHCAEIYGADILLEAIEDSPENYTQFLLIEPHRIASRTATGLAPALRAGRLRARRASGRP